MTRGRVIQGLTGLRGVAACSVLVAHSFAHFGPDDVTRFHVDILANGVTLFFVLSGFLIYLPFAQSMLADEPASPNLRRYAASRIRRILPGWIAIFLLVNVVFAVSYVENPVSLDTERSDIGTGRLTDLTNLLLSLVLQQNYVPEFLQTGINPSWTLTTELAFYAVLPFIVLGTIRVMPRRGGDIRWVIVPPAVLLAVSVVGRVIVSVTQDHHPHLEFEQANFGDNPVAVLQRSLLVYGDNFAVGMLVTVAYVAATRGEWPRHPRVVRRSAVAAIPVATVAAMAAAVLGSNVMTFFFAVASGAAVLLIVLPQARGASSWTGARLDWGPLHYLGTISFGIYLWHYPVLLLMSRWNVQLPESTMGTFGSTAVALAVTVLMSSITYYGVERPALQRPRKGVPV